MGRNENVNRPFVRTSARAFGRNRGGVASQLRAMDACGKSEPIAASAASLASSAGLMERPSVEQLERRQMLFSLTITADDVDPATGLGATRAGFYYYIPYLATSEQITDQEPQAQAEGFDQSPYGPIASGTIFGDSGLQILHNINPGSDATVAALPQTADNQDRFVRVRLNETNEFFAFRFFEAGQPGQNVRRSVTEMSFTVRPDRSAVGGDSNGLIIASTRLEVYQDGIRTGVFTGNALRDLFDPPSPNGLGTIRITPPQNSNAFDEVRLVTVAPPAAGVNAAFEIDDVITTAPSGSFASLVTGRAFGAIAALSGPVGATVSIADLYGRDMVASLAGIPGRGTLNPNDTDDNGIPARNDGIGSIRFSGTDSRTSFTLIGGVLSYSETIPEGANIGLVPRILTDGPFVLTLSTDPKGIYDDFERIGFGFVADNRQNQFTIGGLPPGSGSVIVGSPFLRDNSSESSYNPGGFARDENDRSIQLVSGGFSRADQGIFLTDGSSIGSIAINGMLFGSSRFNGAVDRLAVGTLYGSVTVEGDLGSLVVATDAGIWSPEPDFSFSDGRTLDPNNKTNGQLVVGRTVGHVIIGARSQLDVTVVGDVNSPTTRPSRDATIYYEQEAYAQVLPTAGRGPGMSAMHSNVVLNGQVASGIGRTGGQGIVLGDNFLRNDSILAAEVINGQSASVRIKGEVSERDPFNGDDEADVYAFAVDGAGVVNIQGTVANGFNLGANPASLYFRVVDANGTVVAAPDAGGRSGRFIATNLNFRPDGPGVYYLVVMDGSGSVEDGAGSFPYTVAINGLATATLGSYRTGGGQGFTDRASGEGSSITVLSGNIGSLRLGTGFLGAGGTDSDPTSVTNTAQNADSSMSWQGGSIATPGSIYNITTGSDVGPAGAFSSSVSGISVTAGGDLGSFITGLSPLFGGGLGGTSGDTNFLTLNIGGRIGSIDIRGGVGMDQDPDGANRREDVGANSFNIFTGRSGGNGDIGSIRIAWHVAGDSMNITTSPFSTIGALLVSQADETTYEDADARSGIYFGLNAIRMNLGPGSDLLFVDAPRIDLRNSVNVTTPLLGNRTVELIDDAGARVQIRVDGPDGVRVGEVVALPVDGSQGVAIAKIAADLSGGRVLRISGGTGSTGGRASIGRIIVTGDTTSSVQITGGVEIDVWRIEERATRAVTASGGTGLIEILNSTLGGDIVAIDVAAVGQVSVDGNLGSTVLPAFGPQRIGPRLGIAVGAGGAVGTPIGINGGLFDTSLSVGKIQRAIRDSDIRDGSAALDDIGSPVDPFLNGLLVRGGNVQQVRARGSLGDVILLGATSTLQLATANYDLASALNTFEGVVGTIYATNILRVDVGDGLRRSDPSPFATSGIFARNNLVDVSSLRVDGSVLIEGPISASNSEPDVNTVVADGINNISFIGATIRDTYLGVQDLDGFWQSFLYGDDNVSRGDIGDIQNTNGIFFGTEIRAADVRTVRLTNTFFDASRVGATGDIGTITAQGFRNTSLTGSLDELRVNEILGAGDVDRIEAIADMDDLYIDLTGNVRVGVLAVNINRATIDVDNELRLISASNAIRASSITVGQLTAVTSRDVYASTFLSSGLLAAFTVSNTIQNTSIAVTGPDGRIDAISATNGISGEISATGPIGTVTSSAGDIDARITTTTSRGNVGVVSAGRDLVVRTDVSGNIAGLNAGRNIGRLGATGVVLIRGDLGGAAVPTGSLYSDIRVGGAITGTVTIGGAVGTPTNNQISYGSIIAFSSIRTVAIAGDFDGDIISYSGGITSIAFTNGSFLQGNTIAAYDGSLGAINITNGSLYGNVHADFDITLLNVVAGVDGIFGDVGVNPGSSAAVAYDPRRNQLPPGIREAAGYQGPTISANRNIVKFVVTGGNVYEAAVFAERAITSIAITGNVGNDSLSTGLGSYFAAGDAITSIVVTGNVSNALFVAGMVDLGSDGRAGGAGKALDTVKSGNITAITVTGRVENSTFVAGINSGADGVYATGDDFTAFGVSSIAALTFGTVGAGVAAFGDNLSASVANDNRYARGGTTLPNANSSIFNPATTALPAITITFTGTRAFNTGTNTITITLTGGGTGIFLPGVNTGTLYLVNTTAASVVTVASSAGTLNGFDIFSTDDASLNSLTVSSILTGDSDITIDGNVNTLSLARVEGTGTMAIGGDSTAITIAGLVGGELSARAITTLSITGQFGATNANISGEASIFALSTGAVNITGAARGLLRVNRDTASLTAASADRSVLSFGNSVGNITLGSARSTVISAGDSIGAVSITGDFFDSALVSGVDFGTDSFYGGVGSAADVLSTGTIGAVSIAGNFQESDIVAGFYRGGDGFYGTIDDTVAAGRGVITSVTIGGTQVGSTRSTEAYRIASSGSLGVVRIGGAVFSGARSNFATEAPLLTPASGQVVDINVTVDNRVFIANLNFNQPVDFSSVPASLSVSEVRGNGDIEIRLIQGVDYTLGYEASTNTIRVIMARSVTERDLPLVPDRPGPGVYRFEIDPAIFRARLVGVGLDGDGDGFSEPGDQFSEDAIVGDAGDKITASVGTATGVGTTQTRRVDFYGASNLNFVLDSNTASDNLPDVNTSVTVRGFIGDHPDNDTNLFRFAGDVDVYAVTLQAGQILRLGRMQGTATLATRQLVDPTINGTAGVISTVNDFVISLPAPTGLQTDITFAETYLIQQTGTYYIVVGNTTNLTDSSVINPNQFPLRVGDYNFTVEVFDDGDSGFTSDTTAGDGTPIVVAPPAQEFAGPDGQLGNTDDLPSILRSGYRFTRDGTTGAVTGSNGVPSQGTYVTSSRDAAGALTQVVTTAIGPRGHAGVPNSLAAADVDIFHLNNRLPVAPGTKLKVTVRLTQFGADLGQASPVNFSDNRGFVQFGVFETSASRTVDDGVLVFSPTDFRPIGGVANNTIADNGTSRYGFDANGDFFAEFVVPSRAGSVEGVAGTFAVYLQGVFNTDYQLEIVTNGTGVIQKTTQNVFLETNGGAVSWLEAGGFTTQFGGFDVRTLGFTGQTSAGLAVNDYVLRQLVSSLNSIYQGAGLDVRFSTNPADFEFQPFSTVFLSNTSDPVLAIYNSFSGAFNFDFLSRAFESNQPYGFSEHSDPFNIDLQDEAIVFLPSFAIQGIEPGIAGLDTLTQALTGAVTRRVGELMGLRISEETGANPIPPTFASTAADAPENLPGTGRAFALSNVLRDLSNGVDSVNNTNFFLGGQNEFSLLNRVLSRR